MDFLVAIRAVFDSGLQDFPYLLQSFVGVSWCNKTAFSIDQESILFPLMKWSPSLFGQINDWIVSGAGFVSLQMPSIEIKLVYLCTQFAPLLTSAWKILSFACNLHVDI